MVSSATCGYRADQYVDGEMEEGSTEGVQEAGGTFDHHCCISLPPLAQFWSSL